MKTLKSLLLVTIIILLSGCATEVGIVGPGVIVTPAPIYVDPFPAVVFPYTYYRPYYHPYYAPRYYHSGPIRGPIHGPGPRR